MRVIEGRIPPGGWHYMQGDIKIESHGFDPLLEAVQTFRLENSIPVNDVRGDVVGYICTNFPRHCTKHHISTSARPFAPSGAKRFVDKIIEWAVEMTKREAFNHLETETEANRRANICVNCPHNKEWENSCPPCVVKARQTLVMLRQKREVLPKRRLHACSVLNQCNKTAVWIQSETLVKGAVPPNCWLK